MDKGWIVKSEGKGPSEEKDIQEASTVKSVSNTSTPKPAQVNLNDMMMIMTIRININKYMDV